MRVSTRYIGMMRRLLLFAVLASLALAAAQVFAQTSERSGAPILLAEVTGVIGPPVSHHVEQSIEEAEARNAEALILQINTPGGLETSMRDIIEDILDSNVPVIGYVAPSGGRAASAGAFIMYATHVAAMAPGTNIGAATPVQLSGSVAPPPTPTGEAPEDAEAPSNSDALDRKAVNDAAAFIRSLAALRGRNAEWAERAVRFGEAVSATEALELQAIEFIATDIDDLLAELDGRVVTMPGGERTLTTQGKLCAEPAAVELCGAGADHSRRRFHDRRGIHADIRRARRRRRHSFYHRRGDADRHRHSRLPIILVHNHRRDSAHGRVCRARCGFCRTHASTKAGHRPRRPDRLARESARLVGRGGSCVGGERTLERNGT